MLRKKAFFSVLFLVLSVAVFAQKPFSEGSIIYRVKMDPAEAGQKPGTFTLIVKGSEIRKEMKMDGMDYTILLNCVTKKVYSLLNRNGRKYAIELKMEDVVKDQWKFLGFRLSAPHPESNKIAGYAALTGDILYKDGTSATVLYSKDWKPVYAVTYERFPNADFLPLDFYYKDESGITMRFIAERIEPGPVNNAVFGIPHDYKIISNAEYEQLSR